MPEFERELQYGAGECNFRRDIISNRQFTIIYVSGSALKENTHSQYETHYPAEIKGAINVTVALIRLCLS